MSDESIKPVAYNNSLALALNHINTKLRVKVDGHYLNKIKKHHFTSDEYLHY